MGIGIGIRNLGIMALLGAASAMCLSGCGPFDRGGTAMFANGPMHSGVFESEAKGELKGEKWRFKTKGPIYSSPVVTGGLCIIGSGDGSLYALKAGSGKPAWRYKTGGPVHSTPAVSDGKVFVVSRDGHLHAVSLSDGKRLWRFATKGESTYDDWDPYLSSPTVKGDTVFFGSSDGNLYAVDADSGKRKWAFKTGGMVHSSPALDETGLYFGNCEGKVFALEAETGKKRWEYKTMGWSDMPNGEIIGSPSVHDGLVYIGAKDHSIQALDVKTGKEAWREQSYPGWVISAPAIHGGNVIYSRTGDYQVYARNAKTGEPAWQFDTGYFNFASPAVAGDTVYVGGFSGVMHALDATNGKERWSFKTLGRRRNGKRFFDEYGFKQEVYYDMESRPADQTGFEYLTAMGSILSSPWVSSDTLYFGSADGWVYALGIK